MPGAVVKLVLASASARRKQLLGQIGVQPDEIIPSDIDEDPRRAEAPRALALRLAEEKANACQAENAIILSADTVVAVGSRILPKTLARDEAERCLQLLSGRAHRVITGVAVRGASGDMVSRAVTSRVIFKRLDQSEINNYLDSNEWDGKAGGYAIQGRAGAFVKTLNGSYSSVVGLPLLETRNLLMGMGYPI